MNVLEELLRPVGRAVVDYSDTVGFISGLPSRKPFTIKYGMLRRWREIPYFSNAIYLKNANGIRALPAARTYNKHVSDFTVIGDGRRWHPMGRNRPLLLTSTPAGELKPYDPFERLKEHERRILKPSTFSAHTQARLEQEAIKLRFSYPRRVVICLKRAMRKEIMHALGHAGKPVSKIRRLNELSKIHC